MCCSISTQALQADHGLLLVASMFAPECVYVWFLSWNAAKLACRPSLGSHQLSGRGSLMSGTVEPSCCACIEHVVHLCLLWMRATCCSLPAVLGSKLTSIYDLCNACRDTVQ